MNNQLLQPNSLQPNSPNIISANIANASIQNHSVKTFPFGTEDPSESLYDTLGWNESSFNEEDNLYIQINNVISAKARTVSYARVEDVRMPTFLRHQTSACEKCSCITKIFCCCFYKKPGYRIEDVEESDLLIYNNFKLKAAEVYNPDDNSHENSLRFLYVQTLSCDLVPKLINNKWKDIGFTCDDPRIDIKIGGYYALLFINHFIMSYEEEFELIRKSGKTFYFAMCAIIVCLYLRLALDAFNSEKIADTMRKENNIQPVNVFQFINFCRNYNANCKFPFELMANILLAAKEEIIKESSPNLTRQIFVVKNHFNSRFYQELNSSYDYGNSEASIQSSEF